MISKYAFRLFISLIICLIFGFLISEASFQVLTQGEADSREEISITIPNGTAERIRNGYLVPSIPENIVFYEGDRIVVNNEDTENHQLGPIWVPPGSQGVLNLQNSDNYSLTCTFQPGKMMGIEVRPKITSYVRFQGILAIGLPTGVLGFLFSLIIFPIRNDLELAARRDKET
jgi:hypothetical protein